MFSENEIQIIQEEKENLNKKIAADNEQKKINSKMIVDKKMREYQEEFSKLNRTTFYQYNNLEDESLLAPEDPYNKTIKPGSLDDVHFFFQVKMKDCDKVLIVDSYWKDLGMDIFWDRKKREQNAVTVIPVMSSRLVGKNSNSTDSNWHFQSSNEGCTVIGSSIARLLSFVPNEILQECIESGKRKNLAEKFGDTSTKAQTIFDWKLLDEKMPMILPHMLSFCQNSTWMKKFCELQEIDLDKVMQRKFVKITNIVKNYKPNKQTSLVELLEKHKVSQNGRMQNCRTQHKKQSTINKL